MSNDLAACLIILAAAVVLLAIAAWLKRHP